MAIAFFSTWTTYGTWLPGDARGWLQRAGGVEWADGMRAFRATLRMTHGATTLDAGQRSVVEATVLAHCGFRGWTLHAVNCRSNHVHAVVTAPDRTLAIPREQFKAWCSRKLSKSGPARENWWSERGWDEYLDDEQALAVVIDYVRERQ
jgi:REP element-mobilizing transposase RayT